MSNLIEQPDAIFLEKERDRTIDEIVEMYPELQLDKRKIKKQIEKKNVRKREEQEQTKAHAKEIVLEKINYKDKNYYKDKFGSLLNDKAEIVGISRKNPANRKEIMYELFEDCEKIDQQLEIKTLKIKNLPKGSN